MLPSSSADSKNRFDDFFIDPLYLELKNQVYNYLIRKKTIRKFLRESPGGTLLEIGSGMSPISPCAPNVIYADLSEQALANLKKDHRSSHAIVMSATQTCLKSETIATVVCSEVLEHIPKDGQALEEIWRVLRPGGSLILTVPMHAYFFSIDDRFVEHCRRYDPKRLTEQLRALGFHEIRTVKIAGVLEKIAMLLAVIIFKMFSLLRLSENKKARTRSAGASFFISVYNFLNWFYGLFVQLEALLIPRSLATIMLFYCKKKDR